MPLVGLQWQAWVMMVIVLALAVTTVLLLVVDWGQ
jgi:hypothetical protein